MKHHPTPAWILATMATVFVPPMLRSLTSDRETVSIDASTLGELLDALNAIYPGFRERICIDGQIRPELSVWLDDQIASRGLAEALLANSEVHFLPALGGGC